MNSGEGSTNLSYFDDVGLLLSLGACRAFSLLNIMRCLGVILPGGLGKCSTGGLFLDIWTYFCLKVLGGVQPTCRLFNIPAY